MLYIAGGAIVSVVASLITFHALIGQNFDSVHRRIDDARSTLASQVSKLEASVDSVGAQVSQIDKDLLFVREFVSEIDSLEDKLGYGPELIEARLERLPIGGPGSTPVPEFPTYTKELPFDSERSTIEDWKTRMTRLLETRLTTDRRYSFDPEKHDIEVFENVVIPIEADAPRLDLTAVAVFKE